MSNRKSVLMMKIAGFVATPDELREIEALYELGKGPAHHKILRLLERYFEKQFSDRSEKASIRMDNHAVNMRQTDDSWCKRIQLA